MNPTLHAAGKALIASTCVELHRVPYAYDSTNWCDVASHQQAVGLKAYSSATRHHVMLQMPLKHISYRLFSHRPPLSSATLHLSTIC